MTPHRLLAGLALGAAATAASAQTTAVYRCGNTYSSVPCASGRVVDTNDATVDARRHAEAKRIVADERRLADEMAADRRRAEAAIKPAMAGSLGPQRVASADPKTPAKSKAPVKKGKRGSKSDENGDFVATVPKSKA